MKQKMEDFLPQEVIDIVLMFCDEDLLVKAIKDGNLQKVCILWQNNYPFKSLSYNQSPLNVVIYISFNGCAKIVQK